jgi:hypothetical protein
MAEWVDGVNFEVFLAAEVLEPIGEGTVLISGPGSDGECAGAVWGDGGGEGEEVLGVFEIRLFGGDVTDGPI